MSGAQFFSLRNTNDWVIPVFKCPFTSAAIDEAFATSNDPDAFGMIPVTHKFRNYASGTTDYPSQPDGSIHFKLLDEGRPQFTELMEWFRDVEIQTLAGVNWRNLNKGRRGYTELRDVSSSPHVAEQYLRLVNNPQGNSYEDTIKPYGPETTGYTSLPIDVTIPVGAWRRNEPVWSGTSVGGVEYFTVHDPDRGVRTNVSLTYPPAYPGQPSEIAVEFFDAMGFTGTRGASWDNDEYPLNAIDLTLDVENMAPILSVEQFDPATWGSLPVTGSRRWDNFWKVLGRPAYYTSPWYDSLFRVSNFMGIYVGVNNSDNDLWSGVDRTPLMQSNPMMYWWNKDCSVLPHFFIETIDGVLRRFTIKIYSNETIGWKLAAVSSRPNRTYNGYRGTPSEDCRDRLVARYNPRAKTSTVGIYIMDGITDFGSFTNDLYNLDFTEWAVQLFAGAGTEALLGMRWYYGIRSKIVDQGTRTSKPMLGKTEFFNSNRMRIAGEEIVEYHMGTIVVPATFGDHRDFTEGDYKLWIPMVGLIDLNPFDVVGQTLALIYYINIADGSAIVQVQNCADCTDGIIFATSFTYGIDIPIRINPQKDAGMVVGGAAIKAVTGALGGASVGGGKGAAAGALIGAGSAIAEGSGTGLSYSVGELNGATNMLGDFRPKLIYYVPSDLTGSSLANVVGLPSAGTFTVGSASGYLRATEVQNTDSLPARYADEIVGLLKTGIYTT